MKTLPRAMLAGLLVFVLAVIILRLVNQTTQPAAASQTNPQMQTGPVLVIAQAAQDAISLSLVYGETNPESTETTLYRVAVNNLSQKTVLATIRHKIGYPPTGTITSDGRKIALLVIPPQVDERAARIGGGEIWTLNSNGTGLIRAAFRAGWLEQWSPDGQWIVFSRLTPLTTPNDPQVPFRTEFYRVKADGSTGNLLLSDDTSYALIGLGWGEDGAYLAAREDLNGIWRITAQDAISSNILQTWQMPETTLLRSISLSPNGRRMMFEDATDEQVTLHVIDLETPVTQAQAGLASAPVQGDMPVGPFQPLWRVDQNIWLYRQPREGESARAGLIGNESSAILPQIEVGAGEHLLPQSWSPDGSWLLWQLYPRNATDLYLQKDGESEFTRLQPEKIGNWLTLIGWIDVEGGTE